MNAICAHCQIACSGPMVMINPKCQKVEEALTKLANNTIQLHCDHYYHGSCFYKALNRFNFSCNRCSKDVEGATELVLQRWRRADEGIVDAMDAFSSSRDESVDYASSSSSRRLDFDGTESSDELEEQVEEAEAEAEGSQSDSASTSFEHRSPSVDSPLSRAIAAFVAKHFKIAPEKVAFDYEVSNRTDFSLVTFSFAKPGAEDIELKLSDMLVDHISRRPDENIDSDDEGGGAFEIQFALEDLPPLEFPTDAEDEEGGWDIDPIEPIAPAPVARVGFFGKIGGWLDRLFKKIGSFLKNLW